MKFKLVENEEQNIITMLKSHFLTNDDTALEGPIYILPDGIELSPMPKDYSSDMINHADIEDYLYDNNLSMHVGSYSGDASPTLSKLGAIRCSDIAEDNNYIELSPIKPTSLQYFALEDWLDRNRYSYIAICTPNMENYVQYDLSDVDYIINRIKRYYSSGRLYESKEQNYMNTINKIIKKKRKDKHTLPYNNSFGPHNEKKDIGINDYNLSQFNNGFANNDVSNSCADGGNSVSVGEGLDDIHFNSKIEENYNNRRKNKMPNTINLREELNRIDRETDNKYDLRNLYDSLNLTVDVKKQITEAIINDIKPDKLYEGLYKLYEGNDDFSNGYHFEFNDTNDKVDLDNVKFNDMKTNEQERKEKEIRVSFKEMPDKINWVTADDKFIIKKDDTLERYRVYKYNPKTSQDIDTYDKLPLTPFFKTVNGAKYWINNNFYKDGKLIKEEMNEDAWAAQDYKKFDNWEQEDIDIYNNTDWKERDYKELPVPDDNFMYDAVLYDDDGEHIERVNFIKFIRPNPIYPPYYAPDNKPFEHGVGPMYDGESRGKYDIHNRYESQDIYDRLSESNENKTCPECGNELDKYGYCYNKDCDASNHYFDDKENVDESFIHYDEKGQFKPLATADSLKVNDLVYDDTNGHTLKVTNIDKSKGWEIKLDFLDLDTQANPVMRVGKNSLFELADESDSVEEIDNEENKEFWNNVEWHSPEDYFDNINESMDNVSIEEIETFINKAKDKFNVVDSHYDGDKHTIEIQLSDIENSPIEDIEQFIDDAINTFNTTSAYYDGDSNSINITLDENSFGKSDRATKRFLSKNESLNEDNNKIHITIDVNVMDAINEAIVSGNIEDKYDEQTLEDWYDFASNIENIIDKKFIVTNISLSKKENSLSEYIDFYLKDENGNKLEGMIDLRLSDHKSNLNVRRTRKNKANKLDPNYKLVSIIVNGKQFENYNEALTYTNNLLDSLNKNTNESLTESINNISFVNAEELLSDEIGNLNDKELDEEQRLLRRYSHALHSNIKKMTAIVDNDWEYDAPSDILDRPYGDKSIGNTGTVYSGEFSGTETNPDDFSFIMVTEMVHAVKWHWFANEETAKQYANRMDEYNKYMYGESLNEDTIKQNGKWVNKGKEGTHGTFKTKKEADAQRKAMFARGYKECIDENIKDDTKATTLDFTSESGTVIANSSKEAEETYDELKKHYMQVKYRRYGNKWHLDYSKPQMFESIDDDFDITNMRQEYTSANTSINSSKLPAIFNLIKFEPDTINLDYGGGKFDNATEALAQQNVTNLIYDPHNRSTEHNNNVLNQIKENGGADSVTCSNVLNVIKEPEVRLNVLQNIKKLVKSDGKVYITVYEGTGKEMVTKSGYQLGRKTADYLDEIRQVFPNAKRRGKLIIAQ